jgi:hypothetical protein
MQDLGLSDGSREKVFRLLPSHPAREPVRAEECQARRRPTAP